MSRYRKIEVKTWTDSKFQALSPLPPSGQSLWIWLLTGPQTGQIPGLFSAGEMAMAEMLKWSLESFRGSFRECLNAGMVKVDSSARLVWIPKAIQYNHPHNPNIIKSWRDSWETLPECPLKSEAHQYIETYLGSFKQSYAKSFLDHCPNHSRNHCRIQEQEQEQEQEVKTSLSRETENPNPAQKNSSNLIPEDYRPPNDITTKLHIAGKPHVDPFDKTTLAKFIAYHQGAGTVSPNWNAKYFSWCLNEYGAKPNGTGSKSTFKTTNELVRDKIREITASDETGIAGRPNKRSV